MPKQPNMRVLKDLREVIADHLADIAPMLTSDYKLTFVARVPGEHSKTIIVTDDEDLAPVQARLLSRSY